MQELEWNGEGFPGAGTKCEALNTCMAHPEYESCLIHWIGEYAVVYTSESCKERMAQVGSVKFRPIQTKEEKALKEIVDILSFELEGMGEFGSYVDTAKALYKAGYRKQ